MSAHWKLALVTGASSGIGDAMARQLAAAGTDLVVVARNTGRLDQLASELRDRHQVTVEVLPADLADPQDLRAVERRLGSPPAVDLLVNNAGFGTTGPFVEADVDTEEREVAVNVVAPMRLTRAALAPMVARRSGTILNVSSMASLQAVPNNATYGASKAFLTQFSESVHEEVRGTGVKVTAVLPGFTRTEFAQRAGMGETAGMPGFVWQSAEQCAREALDGAAAGHALVVPGRLNKVAVAVAAQVPRGLKRRLVALMSGRFGL